MEKSIIIKSSESGHKMEINGFTAMEVLGILRFQEKYIWLKILEDNKRANKNLNEPEYDLLSRFHDKLSVACLSALKQNNITKFSELCSFTEEEILRLNAVGKKVFSELSKFLRLHGLTFKK